MKNEEQDMLLNIGPRYLQRDKTRVGGIVVQFEDFLEWLDKNGFPTLVIDTNKKNYPGKLFAWLFILYKILRDFRKAERIILHATFNDCVAIAPFVVMMSRITHKKIVLRKFAGSFDLDYQRAGWLKRKILSYVLTRVDTLLFETRYLVEFGLQFNSNVYQCPNARREYFQRPPAKAYSRKLLFLSQVMREKGVDHFVQMKALLPPDFIFTVVGPIVDAKYDAAYFQRQGVVYEGAVLPSQVKEVLGAHDFLVLPTSWSGEGYPGVVIEALSTGTPVIATGLRGISEVISPGENGFLFSLDNIGAAIEFIKSMDGAAYQTMSLAAYQSSKAYDTENVYRRIVEVVLR